MWWCKRRIFCSFFFLLVVQKTFQGQTPSARANAVRQWRRAWWVVDERGCCWICRARGCIERVSRSRDCLEWRFSPYHDIIFFPLLFYFYNILRFLADWNFSTNAFEAFFSFLTTTTTHGMMLFQYLKWRAPEAFCTPMLFGGWLVGSIHVHVLEIAQPCVFFCCYSRSFCPFSTDSLL